MHLKCNDWTRFGRKHRLQNCPNGQVITIFARSPKTRIFCKSAKGGPRKFFKTRPKSSPRLKGPKGHWRKWHYPLIFLLFKVQTLENIFAQTAAPEVPNGQVMGIFARSFKTRILWKSAKGGPKEIFQKSFKKKKPRLKGRKALLRKWYYPVIIMHLKGKNGRRFWHKQRL